MDTNERFDELWADFKAKVQAACSKPAFDNHADKRGAWSHFIAVTPPIGADRHVLINTRDGSASIILEREQALGLAADLVASVVADDQRLLAIASTVPNPIGV